MTGTEAPTRWKLLQAQYLKARERRVVRWGIDLVILAAIVAGLGAWQTRDLLKRGAPVDLTLQALGGDAVSFASLRGKPVVVSFWAPWCGVCKEVSPNLSRLQSLVGDRAHVVSIATSWQNVDQVQAFVRERGVQYPVLLGGDRELAAFHVRAFPTLYFLDAEGKVKGSVVGYTTTLGLLMRLWF